MTKKQHTNRQRTENAVLTIRSIQRFDADETDSSELNTTAVYSYHPQQTKIIYKETDDLEGTDGETEITVLDNSLVTIHKTGFVETSMVLEVGKKHPVHYHTLIGTMEMQLCALAVIPQLQKDGGRLMLRYALEFNDSFASVNTIDLRIMLRKQPQRTNTNTEI